MLEFIDAHYSNLENKGNAVKFVLEENDSFSTENNLE